MSQTTQTSATASAWAAILAAAVGCAAMGILTTLSEMLPRISLLLTFSKPVGDLSGVTTISLLIWLLAWFALHRNWRNRQFKSVRWIVITTFVLILLGLIGTLPLI